MEVFEAIDKRHSYRGEYKDKPIPREKLIKIVQAGLQAPSGRNAQTTEFVIVDDPELILKIVDIVKKSFLESAKAIIACIVEPHPVYHNISFEVEDCSAAVENMLLAVTALGYATVWIDGNIRLDGKAEKISSLLKVPPPKYVRIILPLGIPAEKGIQKEKKSFAERAWFNKYGA